MQELESLVIYSLVETCFQIKSNRIALQSIHFGISEKLSSNCHITLPTLNTNNKYDA